MSVTFSLSGSTVDNDCEGFCEECCGPQLNLASGNARALFDTLGLAGGEDLYGSLSGRELRKACAYYLERAEEDPGLPARVEGEEGRVKVIYGSRPAGYLRIRVTALLALALAAGDLGRVCWG